MRRFNTGFEDGNYSLIAGHVEPSETPSQAIVREALEEASIEIALEDLRFVQAVHRECTPELAYMDYYFEANRWSGNPRIVEPERCSDLGWFPGKALPGNVIPYIRAFLAQC
jgi:8-oxo-dGTP pyrophosphatase MutT (NUDIX family)